MHACQAVSLAALGSVLQGCSGSSTSSSARSVPALPTVSGTAGGGQVSVNVDGNSPLAAVGGAALVQSSSGAFLVLHTAQTTFTALTATCTHEACIVTGYDGQRFVCPCHGSEYDMSGQVRVGPAQAALRQFATQFTDTVLTIRL